MLDFLDMGVKLWYLVELEFGIIIMVFLLDNGDFLKGRIVEVV